MSQLKKPTGKSEGVGERPPEPPMTADLGDRTPAWAEWCRRHDPERFARHFHDLRPYEEI